MIQIFKSIIAFLGAQHLFGWLYRVLRIPSAWVLVVVNLLPIVGVFVFGWNPFDLIIAYWVENLVIGVLNYFKILIAQGDYKKGEVKIDAGAGIKTMVNKIYLAHFFLFHYGIFTAVHGVFVFTMFAEASGTVGANTIFSLIGFGLALLFSHIFSFFYNFLGKDEYQLNSPDYYFSLPYGRIFPIHITIIIGGLFTQTVGASWPLAVVFVILKIIIDLGGHFVEHKNVTIRT